MISFSVSHANLIVSMKGKEPKPPVSHQSLNGSPAVTLTNVIVNHIVKMVFFPKARVPHQCNNIYTSRTGLLS